MGHRYYCDYCDKVFIDDIDARKKHLNSAYHIKLRRQHYDSFRDLSTIWSEESIKVPCRRFQTSGFCQFESSCKYTHYTQEQLWEIKQMLHFDEQKTLSNQHKAEYTEIPMAEEWLAKYTQKRDAEHEKVAKAFWSYPQQLENRFDLPPSLKKFQPEYFQDSNFNEWGKLPTN